MPGRWGPDGPPPEAYSRLTNPQRFAPVIDAADALVETLVATYDVTATPVALDRCLRAVRLEPRAGAQITFGVTDHPGVRLAVGNWCDAHAPQCGCDACDETADSAIEAMLTLVEDVVKGRFSERLRRRPRRLEHSFAHVGGWMSISAEHFSRLALIAPPGARQWPAWPRRDQ